MTWLAKELWRCSRQLKNTMPNAVRSLWLCIPFHPQGDAADNRQAGCTLSCTKDQKKHAPRNAAKAVSIDAPISEGNKYTLLDILINKDAQPADDNTAFAQMLNDLKRCVGELEERDRIVISKFYGIGMAHETLAEIAEDLQLKRERVRQIRDKAIRQISKNTTSKVLKHFLRK